MNCISRCRGLKGHSARPGARGRPSSRRVAGASPVSLVDEPPGQAALADGRRATEGDIRKRRVQVLQEPGNRPSDGWVDHRRGDLGGRLEDEPPPRHPRMRHPQERGLDHHSVIEQQIEVQRSRAPAVAADPAQLRPRPPKGGRETKGGQRGLQHCGPVEEVALAGRAADRHRLAPAAPGEDSDRRKAVEEFQGDDRASQTRSPTFEPKPIRQVAISTAGCWEGGQDLIVVEAGGLSTER